ncbi:hypothetical protein GCM10011571_04340 [Marinithermofilum abyssi]|uniref:histidine kinase n=1 Tax=Marinithermofilum abyssi TaxID=1571185 RepID=A0A8J2VE89_9BACL|nr:ATP-binding protein [Marinithermofilum abyssi]GGE06346.1 hypothetical protein GCM10011571_04340 [Marinithermofilum abyssi]
MLDGMYTESKGGQNTPVAFRLDMGLQQLKSWVKRMSQAAMVVDDRGRVMTANPRLLKWIGLSEGEIVDQPYSAVVHIPVSMHRTLHCTENASWPVHFVSGSLLVHNAPPQSISIQWISGMTDDRRFHLLLFVSKALSLANRIIEQLHEGIVVTDAWERIIEINDAACGIFGISRDGILGLKLSQLLDRIAFRDGDNLLEKVKEGYPFCNHAASWETGAACYQVLVDYDRVVLDHFGNVVSYLIIRDVTAINSLEMQIRQTDRLAMIGQIAAGTAHEMRNPLTSIRGFLQVMKHALKEKGDLKEQGYTEIMLREIDRINDLVSEFLLLSKPRSVRFSPVQVTDVLKEIMPIIQNEALLHNVQVRFRGGREFPQVMADSELLKQVFLNLCKNAIEAMGDGGVLTIRIKVLKQTDKLAVEVQDTGPGIPAYAKEKIFDPFFTTKENGTGLGLSVCQRILQDIGGDIHVSSKEMGTTFSVLLPHLVD